MTPDEVVKTLEAYYSQYSLKCDVVGTALSSALTLIQDYQKLRERVSGIEHQINLFIKKLSTQDNRYFDLKAQEELAEQIVTYLQQPTEH